MCRFVPAGGGYRWIVDTAVTIIVATMVVVSITFLMYGLFRSQGGPKATDEPRWAAQATLAEMRNEGAGLPSEVGEKANRSEGTPRAERPGAPTQGSSPPSGAD
jgi:hypothetical protein